VCPKISRVKDWGGRRFISKRERRNTAKKNYNTNQQSQNQSGEHKPLSAKEKALPPGRGATRLTAARKKRGNPRLSRGQAHSKKAGTREASAVRKKDSMKRRKRLSLMLGGARLGGPTTANPPTAILQGREKKKKWTPAFRKKGYCQRKNGFAVTEGRKAPKGGTKEGSENLGRHRHGSAKGKFQEQSRGLRKEGIVRIACLKKKREDCFIHPKGGGPRISARAPRPNQELHFSGKADP